MLIGRVQVSEVVQEHLAYPSLWVLAAGRVPPNPSELLGSKIMTTLLQRLAKGATVIDASPLLPVTDAAVLRDATDYYGDYYQSRPAATAASEELPTAGDVSPIAGQPAPANA